MRTIVRMLLVLLTCLLAAGTVYGATLTVPVDYASIQDAMDSAQPGDTVLVLAGEYTESVTLRDSVNLVGDTAGLVVLRGTEWSVLTADTIGNVTVENIELAGEGGQSTTAAYMVTAGVSFKNISAHGFSTALFYRGTYSTAALPIVENSSLSNCGTGIWLRDSANAIIRNNSIVGMEGSAVNMYYSSGGEITGNTISGSGYGTYAFDHCNPLIKDNIIEGNSTGMSHAWSSNTSIINNLITGNAGYGIYAVTYSSPQIKGNIISKNGSDGMWMFLNWPTVENNTIVENAESGVANSYYSSFILRNNIIANNGEWGVKTRKWFDNHSSWIGLYYNDVYGNGVGDIDPLAYLYTGNISQDPLFKDAAAEDYRILLGSPCRDAGDPNPSYNDYDGTRNDMGAFGGPYAMPIGTGIPELIAVLNGKLIILPDGAFKNEQAGRKDTIERKLDVVIKMFKKADDTNDTAAKIGFYTGALDKLEHDILPKCDGHFDGNPKNDWIVTYEAQSIVYPIIVDLIDAVQTELNALL